MPDFADGGIVSTDDLSDLFGCTCAGYEDRAQVIKPNGVIMCEYRYVHAADCEHAK